MSYQEDLPRVFPFRMEQTAENVELLVSKLLERAGSFAHGTSFAVTSDVTRVGNRVLWLSRWSAVRLWKAGLIEAAAVGRTPEDMQMLSEGWPA